MTFHSTELQAFRHFLDVQIASGEADLTPEESLAIWQELRRELPGSITSLNETIAQLETGITGKPLRQFVTEFRAKHQIPDA